VLLRLYQGTIKALCARQEGAPKIYSRRLNSALIKVLRLNSALLKALCKRQEGAPRIY
jgi:hypothetical protein